MPEMMREAMYYQKASGKSLVCRLCPRYCMIQESEQGFCRSRANIDGTLYATNYAKVAALAMDPIEKKPLYHYHPGSKILSLGPNTCNLNCSFCQNYQISQFEAPTQELSPVALYDLLKKHSGDHLQVAFTYTEPLTWYEYILDFASSYPEVNIVMISNGYLSAEAFKNLLPHVGAFNIDLKAMQDSFYQDECGGRLKPVLQNIRSCVEAKVHLELCFLLIPGLNDAKADILRMADFIAELNPEIPLHISAYHPDFKMQKVATGLEDIKRAIDLVRDKLCNVYGGNLPTEDYMQSFCPNCKAQIIHRSWQGSSSDVGKEARCPHCGASIYGVFA